MNKIFKSLIFPAISVVMILVIYGGLSIVSLDKKASAAQNENTKYDQKISQLENVLSEYQNKLNQVIASNNSLAEQLSKSGSGQSSRTAVSSPQVVTQTKTIYQTDIQEVEKKEATVTIQGVGSYKVELSGNDSAFSILQKAANENGFPLKYDTYSFGVFITGIAGINPAGNQYWSFFYNGSYSNVGASDQLIKAGDNTFWQLSSF